MCRISDADGKGCIAYYLDFLIEGMSTKYTKQQGEWTRTKMCNQTTYAMPSMISFVGYFCETAIIPNTQDHALVWQHVWLDCPN